jgi:NSS family neurotransmitter:Na+ symporter
VRIAGKDILDTFDLVSNYILLPLVAIITCVICGWFIDKKLLPKEIGIDRNKTLRTYFNVLIKYIAPIVITIILVFGLLEQFGVIAV